MNLNDWEAQELEEAIDKARDLYSKDGIHRHVMCDPLNKYHVATLDEIDGGKFPNCKVVFSTYGKHSS